MLLFLLIIAAMMLSFVYGWKCNERQWMTALQTNNPKESAQHTNL